MWQVLTCIFQVSRLWKTGALKYNETISSDFILKLFIDVYLCGYLAARDSQVNSVC